MKHIKKFNEGFINRLFNKDEKEAENIYKRMDSLKKEDITIHTGDNVYSILAPSYSFLLNDFQIESISDFGDGPIIGALDYSLKVEGIKMDASNSICKKIFKKAEKIFNYKDTSAEDEEREFLKKDIKISFRR